LVNFRWLKEEALADPDAVQNPDDIAETLDITLRSIAKQLTKLVSLASSNGTKVSYREGSSNVEKLLASLRDTADDWIEPSFEWRDRYELPNGRAFVALGNLGEWGGGITPSKADKRYWTHGSVPWVSPKDMKSIVLQGSIDHITKRAVEDAGLHLLPIGTLLFVVRGMILAHTFPIAKAGVELTINQDLRYLIPRKGVVSDYLLFVLLNEARHILFAVKESTHGTRRLESDVLKQWPIPILSTREQQQTARRVHNLSRLAESVERTFRDATRAAASLPDAAIAKGLKDGLGLD
jgi:type I restriction enzyme, S subunit